MAVTKTRYYELNMPDGSEPTSIEPINENMRIIDQAIKDAADAAPAVATTLKAGIVKPDGETITVDQDGTIHGANTYTLPTASQNVLGGVKVGNNLSIDGNGILSATSGNYFITADAGCIWKPAVATYADIATTYATPAEGWTVFVEDTGKTYYYTNGEWVVISNTIVPELTYAEALAILEGTT